LCRGAVMTQMLGGSTTSQFIDGTSTLNTALSNPGTQVNFSESLRTVASEQAGHAENAALNNLASSGEHINAVIREGKDYMEQIGQFDASGESANVTDHIGFNEALQDVMHLQERYSSDQEISHQEGKQTVGTGHFGGQLEVRVSAQGSPFGKALKGLFGVSGSVSGSTGYKQEYVTRVSDDTQQRDQASASFTKDQHFNAGLDTLYRQAKEVSARQGEDKTTRFATSIINHFDEAKQYRSEAMSQLSVADSYNKLASLSEEEAINFNSNASQQFKTWLLTQPSLQGYGQMNFREIESMAQNNSPALQGLAQQFITELAPDSLTEFAKTHDINAESVQRQDQQNQALINRDKINQAHVEYEARVLAGKEKTNWRKVDKLPLETVPLSINSGRRDLDRGQARLQQQEQAFKSSSPLDSKEQD